MQKYIKGTQRVSTAVAARRNTRQISDGPRQTAAPQRRGSEKLGYARHDIKKWSFGHPQVVKDMKACGTPPAAAFVGGSLPTGTDDSGFHCCQKLHRRNDQEHMVVTQTVVRLGSRSQKTVGWVKKDSPSGQVRMR